MTSGAQVVAPHELSAIPPWERVAPKVGPCYAVPVRLFNRATLRSFWEKHADAQGPLRAWAEEVERATWTAPRGVKERFGSADFLANDRVVFNIAGNNYRLIAHVAYRFHAVYVRFIGTHAEYDRVDAATI